jgi:hypothetical protein
LRARDPFGRVRHEYVVAQRNRALPTYRLITPTVCATSEKWRRRESNPRDVPHRGNSADQSVCDDAADAIGGRLLHRENRAHPTDARRARLGSRRQPDEGHRAPAARLRVNGLGAASRGLRPARGFEHHGRGLHRREAGRASMVVAGCLRGQRPFFKAATTRPPSGEKYLPDLSESPGRARRSAVRA